MWTYFIGTTETLTGLLLLAGLFTQLAAIFAAAITIANILKIKLKQGFVGGYEYDLLILAAAVAILLLGPGLYSLDLPL
jgi:uncharacterized membrane protein YphA (DoxX/SURF4 family)